MTIDKFLGKTHLTGMNAETTLSAKGQVVIPKEVRDAMDLKPGEKLSVRRVGRRIILEAAEVPRARISFEEFRRRVPKYAGPSLAIEDMKVDFDALWPDRR